MKIRKRKRYVDDAHEKTDKRLERLEGEIAATYLASYPAIKKKWDKFMKAHEKDLKKQADALEKAMLSGVASEIALARAEYQKAALQLVNSPEFQKMAHEVAGLITDTNVQVIKYADETLGYIYSINYNQLGQTLSQSDLAIGYSFNLLNPNVTKALEGDTALLPIHGIYRKVNVPKDQLWNEKQINSQVMQGIQKGESIPKIAERLENVTNMSHASAVRNARTMVTAAENRGRLDSYQQAEDDGIILKKTWLSIHDNRTRDWHRDLDGVTIPLNLPFENSYGEIMFPGDPEAHPANVYNCRCTMIAEVEGFSWQT